MYPEQLVHYTIKSMGDNQTIRAGAIIFAKDLLTQPLLEISWLHQHQEISSTDLQFKWCVTVIVIVTMH